MALRHWSTSASGNASTVGINWAEGQPPSTVNDSAREMMAQVRRQYRPDEWSWVAISNTASVASQTSFRVSTDLTSVFHAQRRVRLQSASTTRYATVVSSSFTAETTVTVAVDAGSLSASHSIAALGPPVVSPSTKLDFLPLAGGMLTGDLTITKSDGTLAVNTPATGQSTQVRFRSAGVDRWGVMKFSDEALYIQRFNASGVFVNNVVHLQTDGAINLNGPTAVNGNAQVNGTLVATGAVDFQSTALVRGQLTTFNTEVLISNPSLARNRYNTGARAWTAGMFNTVSYAIGDETGGQQRMVIDPGGQTRFVGGNGQLVGPGTVFPSGDGQFYSSINDGNYVVISNVNANCQNAYARNTGNWDWWVNGQVIGQLNFANSLGFRSRSNAKAWVYAAAAAIQDAMNVSSVTYNGAGNYTVNFASALPSGSWSVAFGGIHADFPYMAGWAQGGAHSTTQCSVQIRRTTNNGLADAEWHAVWFSGGV